MPSEVEVHPAAEMFPMMSDDEFRLLCEDIKEHGQLEPVTYYDGKLIDGRNRMRACEEVGVECEESELDTDLVPDPYAWVISQNLHRRHLTTGQRSLIAARMATMKEGRPQRETAPKEEVSTTRQQAADLLQVGRGSVDRAKEVIAKGSSAVVKMVENSELPLGTAHKLVKAVDDKREQTAIAKQGKKAVAEKVKPQGKVESKPPRAKKRLPQIVTAFRSSETKADDLKALCEELDPSFKSLLMEWLS